MNDKNDDIFEFDPTSFCQELPQYERVDYVTLTNRYKGEVVHVPSKDFKFNSTSQILEQIGKFYYCF